MISTPGAYSDIFPAESDPNPILDFGCPRSVGGIRAACRLASAMNLEFELHDLDCDPFFHGYGPKCSERNIVFSIWKLPITDIYGKEVEIPFYICEGDGPLLLGNEVIHPSNYFGERNMLEVPPNVKGISPTRTYLPTYTHGPPEGLRTHLNVVPCLLTSIGSYFSVDATTSLTDEKGKKLKYDDAQHAKQFALRFHTYTHMPPKDMKKICNRAGIMTPTLSAALDDVYDNCKICCTTGRPLNTNKVSFNTVLAGFNDHLQVDFLFIKELGSMPILHMVDKATSMSATALMPSRNIDEAAKMITTRWFDIYGAPTVLSADPEFRKNSITSLCTDHNVTYEPRPARRHNKIGIVESNNKPVRLMVQRLLKSEAHRRSSRGLFRSDYEILSKATFLKNIMFGSKQLSSFELAHGYTPNICDLPKATISTDLINAHLEQVSRRAVHKFIRSKQTSPLNKELLPPRTPVYYYKREIKGGRWILSKVVTCEDHIVHVEPMSKDKARTVQVAFEDIRLVPDSDILKELDQMELGFTTELQEMIENFEPSYPEQNPEDVAMSDTMEDVVEQGALDDYNSDYIPDILDDFGLWSEHLSVQSSHNPSLESQEPSNFPSLDIGSLLVTKDIGSTPMQKPDKEHLERTEQEELKRLKAVVGEEEVSEFKLQFAPRWLLDAAIEAERNNYIEQKAIEKVSIKSLPPRSNIISSHHFFKVKTHGETGKLRLKCRLVPHGNRDKDKDSIRSDSSTAQFLCIRILLSLATLFKFYISSIDISAAYLQAGPLKRDVYMRPPKSWTTHVDEIWKLIKPAYGLVESGRLWQLCVEEWMLDYGFTTIPGLPQFFILRREGRICLLVAKVVDDILIAGTDEASKLFYEDISNRFKVGTYVNGAGKEFKFNGLTIYQDPNTYSITVNMREYLSSIVEIPLTRLRKKSANSACTTEEVSQLRGLAGKLNFLGQAVLPQACLVASKIQQFTASPKVEHIRQANAALKQLRKLDASCRFISPNEAPSPSDVLLQTYSDASSSTSAYGQTGVVLGLLLPMGGGSDSIFHPLSWHSSKQARISFSSIGAEILAAADSADRSLHIRECLNMILDNDSSFPIRLSIDSYGLYSTITTLHEGRDYRLRATVSRIRDTFEAKEISHIQWIPGTCNFADALTKINPHTFSLLNSLLSSGKLDTRSIQPTKEL